MSDDHIVAVKYIEEIFYETYFQDRWIKDYTKKIRHEIWKEAIDNWAVHEILTEIKKSVFPRTVITFGCIEEVIIDFKKSMLNYANYSEFNRNLFWTAARQADDVLDMIRAMH